MKLARPDVFHPRIVLAGAPRGGDADLVGALRRRGLHARWLTWDDPDTAAADLVILRGPSDYVARRDDFLAWTGTVSRLLNAPAAIAWNSDPAYLADLTDAGVAIARADGRARPATALVFLGGKPSHAFTTAAAAEPDFELWDVGFAALDAAAAHLNTAAREFLCARIDVVGSIEDARLLRLDLIEPVLGWPLLDEQTRVAAQRAFARCVESACDRFGLGPFSHRRP